MPRARRLIQGQAQDLPLFAKRILTGSATKLHWFRRSQASACPSSPFKRVTPPYPSHAGVDKRRTLKGGSTKPGRINWILLANFSLYCSYQFSREKVRRTPPPNSPASIAGKKLFFVEKGSVRFESVRLGRGSLNGCPLFRACSVS